MEGKDTFVALWCRWWLRRAVGPESAAGGVAATRKNPGGAPAGPPAPRSPLPAHFSTLQLPVPTPKDPAMANETVEDLTMNFQDEEGTLLVKELDKEVLTKGGWA